MKHIAFAALFAASLAAQNPVVKPEPVLSEQMRSIKLELASAIAVEEQEKDLIKAEGLYRVAMDNKELSAEARLFARYRVVALLQKLGDYKEAKAVLEAGGKGMAVSLDDVTNGEANGQDSERTKQLRLQARELLKQTVGKNFVTGRGQQITEQLNWIGDPAVPEVVLNLQQCIDTHARGYYYSEQLRFLWRRGGPVAAAFLVRVADDTFLTQTAAQTAYDRTDIDIEAPEVRAFLDHKEWPITQRFLGAAFRFLDAEELLTLADRGRIEMKVEVLRMLPQRSLDAKQRQRAHAMCRAAISGTNPEYGKAAEVFLTSGQSQQSLEGMQMLLEMVPDLHRRGVHMASFYLPNADGTVTREFPAAEVATLLPILRAAVEAIGPFEGSSPATGWLRQLMVVFLPHGGQAAAQLALDMWDMGYGLHGVFHGQSSPGLSMKLLQRWGKVPANQRTHFLRGFDNVDLPPEALPILGQIANELTAGTNKSSYQNAYNQVLTMVGQTGHDAAADWLLAEWRKAVWSVSRSSNYTPYTWALFVLGKKNQSQRVRSAMGKMARTVDGPQLSLDDRSRLLLAMLSMGDQQALHFVAIGTSAVAAVHPYAPDGEAMRINPLNYLMYKDPKPAHGYSREQILKTVKQYAQRVSGNGGLDPERIAVAKIPDDVLVVLAEEERSNYAQNWSHILVRRLNGKIVKGEDTAVLETCYLSALGDPGRSRRWFAQSWDAIAARYRKQLTALIDGDDAGWAMSAIKMLTTQEGRVDAVAQLRNMHAEVREWAVHEIETGQAAADPSVLVPLLRDASWRVRGKVATYLGAVVHKEAVPGLIALLRDKEQYVRTAAADALTRIRFYHEQQAHWDRVLKGLDASPASAAEKLLVQAKPGADKQQRLLAIKSLGVLGVPEALPFLIDWTQDADKDIGEAAKAAITKIHLSPAK